MKKECELCNKLYSQHSTNSSHDDMEENVNGGGKKSFKCCSCNKTFRPGKKLKIHIRSVHTSTKNDVNKKRQKCNLCGKSCNKLEKHLKVAHNMGIKKEKTTNDEFENSTDGQLVEHKKTELPNSEEESNEDTQSPLGKYHALKNILAVFRVNTQSNTPTVTKFLLQ